MHNMILGIYKEYKQSENAKWFFASQGGMDDGKYDL